MTDVLPSSSTITERPSVDPQAAARGFCSEPAERDEPDDGLPPIDDPYLRPEAQALLARALDRRHLSRRAVGSLASALLFGPIGAVVAIGLGWSARRAIDAPGSSLRGRGLATAGLILGVLVLPSWLVALHAYADDATPVAAAATSPLAAPPRPTPGPRAATRSQTPADQGDFVIPQVTRESQVGAITLVDVGVSASSLRDELAKQRAAAATAGETMLVMTLRAPCEPCQGVERALPDARMQAALAKVRLVRVDTTVFRDDLEALRIPHQGIPGFFLLSPDLRPRDGIDGGEWDDDI
ncbi:MAG: hypothetical protein ABI193_14155, partial [Minicystis sp.]